MAILIHLVEDNVHHLTLLHMILSVAAVATCLLPPQLLYLSKINSFNVRKIRWRDLEKKSMHQYYLDSPNIIISVTINCDDDIGEQYGS